ncbi:MAG: hypothetical protein CBD16_00430 [Betaproteobacteria bacterium TMED156]|nr:MAG: hypothetical protein CBD16_00430 [Betaproteobacteria bacterium TMED156]
MLVCISPVIASSFAYYFFRPEGRINYGALVDNPVNLSDLNLKLELKPKAESFFLELVDSNNTFVKKNNLNSLSDFRGRWLLVRIGNASCNAICEKELYIMRQVRLMTGKNRSRIERVWLIPDDEILSSENGLERFDGTWGLRIINSDKNNLDLLKSKGFKTSSDSIKEGLWLVDPRGLFIMKFPPDPDPKRIYKDLSRLLKVSRIG